MLSMGDHAISFKDKLSELRQNVLDFASSIADKFREVKDAFGILFGNDSGERRVETGAVTLEEYGDAFNELGDSFGTLEKGVKQSEGAGGIFAAIGTFFTGLSDSTKQINPGIILMMSLATVLTYFIHSLGALMQAMANGNGIFGQFKKKFFALIMNMQIAVKAFTAKSVIDAIKGMLLAVAALGAVAAGIALLQYKGVDFNEAIKVLGELMIMTALFAAVMAFIATKFSRATMIDAADGLGKSILQMVNSWSKMGSLSNMVIKMALSMVLIARAISIIADIPTKDLLIASGVMAVLLIIIAGIVIGIDYASEKLEKVWKRKKFQSIATKIFAIAASFLMMAIAIRMINNISVEDWKLFLIKIGTVIGTLALLYLGIKATDRNFGGEDPVDGFAKLLFSIGGSLMLVALALKIISKMSMEEWEQAFQGLLLISGYFIGIIATLGFIEMQMAKKNITGDRGVWNSMSRMVLSISASMIIIAYAFKMLTSTIHKYVKKNEYATLVWASGIIIGLFVLIAGLIVMANKTVKESNLINDPIRAMGNLVLKVAASIILVAFAFAMLTSTVHSALKDKENGTQTLVWVSSIISVLMVLFGAFSMLATYVAKNNSVIGLSSIAAIILSFGAVIAVLAIVVSLMAITFNDLEKRQSLFLAGIVMFGLIAALGIAITFVGNVAKNINWASVMALVVMSAAAIAGLYFLQDVPFGAMILGALGMAAVLTVLIGAATFLSKIKTYSWAGLGAIATVIGAMAALAGIVIWLDHTIDPNNIVKIAIGMAMMVGVLALAVTGLAAAAPALDGLAPVILIAAALIAVVELLLAGLAGIIQLFANAIKTFTEAAVLGVEALFNLLRAFMELGEWFRAQGKQGIIEMMEAFHQFAIMLAVTLVEAFTVFAIESAEAAPKIVYAWSLAIISILQIMQQSVPTIVGLVAQLIVSIINELTLHVDEIVAAVALLMLAFLQTFTIYSALIIDAAAQMVIDFINMIADTVEERSDELAAAVENLMSVIVDTAIKVLVGQETYNKFKRAGIFFVRGAKDGVEEEGGNLESALRDIARKADKAVANEWDEHSPSLLAYAKAFMYMVGAVNGADEGGDLLEDKFKEVASNGTKAFGEYLNVEEGQMKLEEFFGLFGSSAKSGSKSFRSVKKELETTGSLGDIFGTLTKEEKNYAKTTEKTNKALINSETIKRKEGETAEEYRKRIESLLDANAEIDYSYHKQTSAVKENTSAIDDNTSSLLDNLDVMEEIEEAKEKAEKSSKKSSSSSSASSKTKKSDQGESDYAYLSPAGFKHSKEEIDLIQQAQKDLKLSSSDWNQIEQYTLKMIQAGMSTEEINANLQSLAERISDANTEGRDFNEVLEGISINLNADRLAEADYVDLVTQSWEKQTEAIEKTTKANKKYIESVKDLSVSQRENAYALYYGEGNNKNKQLFQDIRKVAKVNKPLEDAIDEYMENIDTIARNGSESKYAYAKWITKYLDQINEAIKEAKLSSNDGIIASVKTWEGSFEDLRKQLNLTDEEVVDFFDLIGMIGVDNGQFGQISESFGAVQDLLNGKNIEDIKAYYEDTFGDWRSAGQPVGEKYFQEFFGFNSREEMFEQYIKDYNEGLDNSEKYLNNQTQAINENSKALDNNIDKLEKAAKVNNLTAKKWFIGEYGSDREIHQVYFEEEEDEINKLRDKYHKLEEELYNQRYFDSLKKSLGISDAVANQWIKIFDNIAEDEDELFDKTIRNALNSFGLQDILGSTEEDYKAFINHLSALNTNFNGSMVFGEVVRIAKAYEDAADKSKALKDQLLSGDYGDLNGPRSEEYWKQLDKQLFGRDTTSDQLKERDAIFEKYESLLNSTTESTKKATDANLKYADSTLTANQQSKKFYQVLEEQQKQQANAAASTSTLGSTDLMSQLSALGLDSGQMDALGNVLKDTLGADIMGENGVFEGFASYAQNAVTEASSGLNMEIVPSLNLDGVSTSLSGMDSTIQMFAQDQAQSIITEMQEFKSGVYHRQSGLHNDLNKVYNMIMQKGSAIISAIHEIDINPNVDINLNADASGIFNVVRKENSKRSKALGRNALGTGGSHPF